MKMRFAAVRESGSGTKRTCKAIMWMSAIEEETDTTPTLRAISLRPCQGLSDLQWYA